MPDRADEFRITAAQCLALAQSTTDPSTRASLILMAQRLYERANRPPPVDFDAVVQTFNDQQLSIPSSSTPLMQQQQQVQPPKWDE
jgi:hypothetical protein